MKRIGTNRLVLPVIRNLQGIKVVAAYSAVRLEMGRR